jgi:phosphatidylinositol kinase/protein kinase (PI-3  family)
MKEVSPFLHTLEDVKIDLQFFEESICKFDERVQLMSSKSRPKKVSIVDPKGKQKNMLLKGMEDMTLDQRFMEIFKEVNAIMSMHEYGSHIQTYKVLPIGERFGMVEWVENHIQLFTVYAEWRQAEQKRSGANEVVKERPLELYEQALLKTLAENKIEPTKNMTQNVPPEIQIQVYRKLCKVIPDDILSSALWLTSPTSKHWLMKVKAYNKSIALTSIIGYVLGIGDRHLDNIMIDMSNGKLLHIDFNVSFDKGKRLRIPELVPFRMSRNLERALGIAGVNGIFKHSATQVLKYLGDHPKLIEFHLESFIHSPLNDWNREATETVNATASSIEDEDDKSQLQGNFTDNITSKSGTSST